MRSSTVSRRRATNDAFREESGREKPAPLLKHSTGSRSATSRVQRIAKRYWKDRRDSGLPFQSIDTKRTSSTGCIRSFLFCLLCWLVVGLCTRRHRALQQVVHPRSVRLHNITYALSPRWNPSPSFHSPPRLSEELLDESLIMDFGNLDLTFLADDESTRVVYRNLWDEEGSTFRPRELNSDDQYYAFDDDHLRGMPFQDQKKKEADRQLTQCRRVSWQRFQFPTCSSFHEMDIVGNTPKYLRCD